MYSAKKVGGRKLYELARKGEEVERKASEIEIYGIDELRSKIDLSSEVRRTKEEDRRSTFDFRVTCSTGTYIRTLAHDIGQKLGTGAILEELKRTAIGDFQINEAVQLNQLTKDNYFQYLIKPMEALGKINFNYIKKAL